MNAPKIIPFSERLAQRKNEVEFEVKPSKGQVIDRRDFHHWLAKPIAKLSARDEASRHDIHEAMSQISERVGRIKIAFFMEKQSDVIAQSARISVLSSQLGLPRTAQLAREIGEAQMAGQTGKTSRLIHKLESIVSALTEDFASEAN